jgi:hypothetical protein
MIEKAQQEDGYLIIYFTVVDKEGRFKNLRDMHEMCECLLIFPYFLVPRCILDLPAPRCYRREARNTWGRMRREADG